jgi:DNA-binding LacI/PurR family transcriptional regulator
MARTSGLDFSVVKRGSAHARVTEVLRGWIRDGQWAKGEFVPSERELAASLGVNRPLVHRAIVTLQSEGSLRRIGSRTQVASRWDELMERAIVVIGDFAHSAPTSRVGRSGAWVQYLEQGVMAATSQSRHNAVTIHPERLHERLVTQLIDAEPLGVVITEVLARVVSGGDVLERFAASKVPVVAYTAPEKPAPFDRVYSNHEVGAYEITKWLISQGRRRIVQMFGRPKSMFWVKRRKAGYERAMQEAGLDPLPPIEHPLIGLPRSIEDVGEQFEVGRRMLSGYLAPRLLGPEGIDAIMAEADPQAFLIAAACRLLGRKPHEEIALAGYDNVYEASPFRALEPCGPQVTMDKQNLEMGFELVSLLMDRIEGRLPPEPQDRFIDPKLVIAQFSPAGPSANGSEL